MAVGDLVLEDFQFEYNDIAIGAGTDYDILSITNLLGFSGRTSTVDRFGRHGGTAGRHYGKTRNVIVTGTIVGTSDTDMETKRQALGTAFAMEVDPTQKKPLVTMFPGAGALKVQSLVRPVDLEIPVDRNHALKYGTYIIRLERTDPRLFALNPTNTVFAVPSGSQVLTNNGNAPTDWVATLVGPAEDPSITNDETGQVISFTGLTLSALETLVIDSDGSTVKVNDTSVSTSLSNGFSWFDLNPGSTPIQFSATNAASASFSMSHRDAYWII